ncbi:protein of unknown function [Methylacidimicrobium sp. AP8]|nr:protein of unknown function [Methylacidimicrobium sp. AP8]
MRILVVEDEEKIAAFVRKGLQEQGFVVDTLSRGDEALLALTAISHKFRSRGAANGLECEAGAGFPTGAV